MKTSLWIAPTVFALLSACSGDSPQDPAGTTPAGGEPVLVEEDLPSPEEEAAKAAESIDDGNADDELKRLEQELGDG
jgi:hypothetical protein